MKDAASAAPFICCLGVTVFERSEAVSKCVLTSGTPLHSDVRLQWFRDLLVITIAMPPRIAVEATVRRGVIASDRNTTPPNAAISGTDNCTVAARMAESLRNAAYQMTYPMPDVSAPDVMPR